MNTDLRAIAEQFRIDGDVRTVRPLGEGFINDTFRTTSCNGKTAIFSPISRP